MVVQKKQSINQSVSQLKNLLLLLNIVFNAHAAFLEELLLV